MRVKKIKGKVYGAELTADEKKAMDIEIERQFHEFDKKRAIEISSAVLLVLHNEFGFGEKRLKKFYLTFNSEIDEYIKRYELGDTNAELRWLCTYKLKELGIDITEWEKESMP